MSPTIDIKALAKTYPAIGKAGITRAVDGVTLTINPGELFFLLGPSGCGKTTLLRMIAGFIEPTEGSIAFNNNDITHTPPNKRNTGMVFQSYALWPHMTIAQNVAFGLGVRKVPATDKTKRVKDALAQVQMTGYESRKPTQLSGGQQQRVALARALVVRPDVLLLDEPLSNLDAKLRLELRSQIRKVCKDASLTTVYVTHDQKEALSMADRVAIMRDGKVIQVGTPRELYRRPRSRFVAEFLGEADFLEATVTAIEEKTLHLDTPAGRLAAMVTDAPPPRSATKLLFACGPSAGRSAQTAPLPLPRLVPMPMPVPVPVPLPLPSKPPSLKQPTSANSPSTPSTSPAATASTPASSTPPSSPRPPSATRSPSLPPPKM